MWDVSTRRSVGTLSGPGGRITALLWIPNRNVVITGNLEGIMLGWSFETRRIVRYFFDPAINLNSVSGSAFHMVDQITGQTVYFTMPCGSALPPGAVCTCDCVTGKLEPPVVPRPESVRPVPVCGCNPQTYCSCNPQTYCSCNKVCTCNPRCICLSVCTCVPTFKA